MTNRLFQRNWIGGEISPEMYGRVEEGRTSYAAAKLRNFIVTPQGVARKRTGTKFVREVRDSTRYTRLIPFYFSPTETLVIEIGPATGGANTGYFRYHTGGQTVLAAPRAYVQSQVVTFDYGTEEVVFPTPHGLQSGDPVQFTTTGVLPSNVLQAAFPPTPNQNHYAEVTFADRIQLRATPGGATIIFAGAPSGTHTAHYFYEFGDITTLAGINYVARVRPPLNTQPPSFAYWTVMQNGCLETPHSYTESEIFDLHYTQSGDIVTLCHPSHPPSELRRYSATRWSFGNALFGSLLSAPAGLAAAVTRGAGQEVFSATVAAMTPVVFSTQTPNGFLPGDALVAEGFAACGLNFTTNAQSMVLVGDIVTGPPGYRFTIKTVDGGVFIDAVGTYNGTGTPPRGRFYWTSLSADIEQKYKVTTLSSDGTESTASNPLTVVNNLLVPGSSTRLTWTPVDNAARYRVYKEIAGLFAYIGQAEAGGTPFFIDDNITPDLSRTPPIIDLSLGGGDYPWAVGHYEQRKVFGGTGAKPQDVWLTNSGSETDLTYSIPIQATDRIYVRMASREFTRIMHVVPLQSLIVLTSSSEWRISPVGAEALTPSSVSVRPQGYVGCNAVQPLVAGGTIIYAAARGGHVREMGYRDADNGYVSGDLCLRAAHLFDDFVIRDMAQQKAPHPVLWFVSSSGKLLGLTYLPGEQVGAWHQHDTDGIFESVCCVPEGNEDAVYVVVRRTINNVTRRYVERFHERETLMQRWASHYLDCSATYFDLNAPVYQLTLPWLAGKQVYALVDGVVRGPFTASGAGVVTFPFPVTYANVGLQVVADLVTPPLAMQMEGMGQGRTKNVSATHARVVGSGPFKVGPAEDRLVPANATAGLESREVDLKILPGWNRDGTVWIRSSDPLPLNVTALTIEVSIGS